MNRYKKILLVRLDRIGDVLLSTPAIKAVRDAYPESHITVMVRPYARDIVDGNPYLNEVILYDKTRSQKGIRANIDFIIELRRKSFDLAIALHPTCRTHLLLFLAGIPERAGYDRKWGYLLTERISHYKQMGLKHETDYVLDMLKEIGIASSDKALYMPVNPDSENRAQRIFKEAGIGDEDSIIVINPSASCPSKRWQAHNFAETADRLVDKYHAKIVIISDSQSAGLAGIVTSSMKNGCLNLSGKTTVADLASVLRRADLFISNDSGPVHIACAVGTPVIAIFGRRDAGLSPLRWGPTGATDIVLHKDVGCARCLAHDCKNGFKCLDAVTVDEVVDAAGKILETK